MSARKTRVLLWGEWAKLKLLGKRLSMLQWPVKPEASVG